VSECHALYIFKIKGGFIMKKEMSKKEQTVAISTIVIAVGVGFILGKRFEAVKDLKSLKGAITLTEVITPMFPGTMSLSEVKELVKSMGGVVVREAIFVEIGGIQRMVSRSVL
jgi:hypothetical protein